MTATERTTWEIAIEGADTLDSINQLIKIAKEQENRDAAVLVAVKAKLMGYVADKELGAYKVPKSLVQMHRTKGRNLLYVGWENGDLHCTFSTSRGIFKNVPEAEFDKLRRVPYPDKLFSTNIKGKFTWEKMA